MMKAIMVVMLRRGSTSSRTFLVDTDFMDFKKMFTLCRCSTCCLAGHSMKTCKLYAVQCSCGQWNYNLLSAGWLWLTQLRNSSQPPTDEHNVFLQAVIERCRKEHEQFLNGGATQCSDNPALFCLLGQSDAFRCLHWFCMIQLSSHCCFIW